MSTHSTPPAAETAQRDDDIFDSDATIAQAGRIGELLGDWNTVVREELGHSQSFDGYDRTARSQQRWHQILVLVSATSGTFAVLMALLQLAAKTLPAWESRLKLLEGSEYFAAVLALASVVLGMFVAFHYRWRLLRFKAEQYRFLKFNYLLHASQWLAKPAEKRLDELRTLMAALHALDNNDNRDWAQGISSLVTHDPPHLRDPDPQLAEDLVRYFRVKRLENQRGYFERRGHDLHGVERRTWWISPACFFLSILFAFFHLCGELYEAARHRATPHAIASSLAESESKAAATSREAIVEAVEGKNTDDAKSAKPMRLEAMLVIWCLLLAAAMPVIGAGVRTYRTAFEFGRNSHRFLGLATFLRQVESELDQTESPLVRMVLLYRVEGALIAENRAWSHLMLEAEWFG